MPSWGMAHLVCGVVGRPYLYAGGDGGIAGVLVARTLLRHDSPLRVLSSSMAAINVHARSDFAGASPDAYSPLTAPFLQGL
jgi:hypothetical protein